MLITEAIKGYCPLAYKVFRLSRILGSFVTRSIGLRNMEAFKKYLPWIIVAVVGLFLLRKLSSQSTVLAPQTQLTETPQTDPFTESRLSAFQSLLQVIGLQIESEGATERARVDAEITGKAIDAEITKANIFATAAEREAQLSFFSRENDRQIQQSAIDRYYSSRNTASIVGSVSQALSGFFNSRNRGGGVFTPPTFPQGFF